VGGSGATGRAVWVGGVWTGGGGSVMVGWLCFLWDHWGWAFLLGGSVVENPMGGFCRLLWCGIHWGSGFGVWLLGVLGGLGLEWGGWGFLGWEDPLLSGGGVGLSGLFLYWVTLALWVGLGGRGRLDPLWLSLWVGSVWFWLLGLAWWVSITRVFCGGCCGYWFGFFVLTWLYPLGLVLGWAGAWFGCITV